MSVRQRGRVFTEFSRWGFDHKGWAKETRDRYFRRALACEEWLVAHRGISITQAKSKDFQAYLFSTTPSARNRNNIRQALLGFGAFLADTGYVEVNYALSLTRLPEPSLQPKPLSPKEAERVLVAAKACGLRARMLVNLFAYTGMRLAEARTLERRHIRGDYFQFSGKGSKERSVPIHAELLPLLEQWLTENKDEARWVFPSPRIKGKPLSETTIKTTIRSVGDLAGIEGLHPHMFRHTFGTTLSEAGVPLEEIQDLMGHANPATTRIYTKVRSPRLVEAIGKLSFAGRHRASTEAATETEGPVPLLTQALPTP